MAITTYTELKSAVGRWINREDLTLEIPDFIAFAENRINRTLRIRAMETAYSVDTVAGTDTVALPTGYAGMRSLKLNSSPKVDLDFVTPEIMDRVWAGSKIGQPLVYTLEGDNIRLGPTPDGVYSLKALYYQKFPALSDSNTTNWLLANAPDALVYGACLEAASYIKDEADVQKYDGLFAKALSDLKTENEKDRYSGGALQMRPDVMG